MLFGYFDESGVHEGASRSVIAGMLGTAAAWEGLSQEWQEIMGGRAFHYTHLNRKFGNGAFKSVAKAERDSIIERCAEAIAKQDLLPVAGGLLGIGPRQSKWVQIGRCDFLAATASALRCAWSS